MRLPTQFLFILVLFLLVFHAKQTNVKVTCVNSENSYRGKITADGFEKITSIPCTTNSPFMNKVYNVSKCESARATCLTGICYK